MSVKVTSIPVTPTSIKKYANQLNVIKQTGESNLNYGSIRIMTDMDPDGNDIQCLLLQLFYHWPDLFLQKRITRLNTPLYVARKGKIVKYFYTQEEYENAQASLKGYTVEYMKGLGSLLVEDYYEAINNANETYITIDDTTDLKLEMAFGDDSQLRKDWLLQT